jgi:hypothetical protein
MSSTGSGEGVVWSRLFAVVVCLTNLGWLVYYYGWVWTMTQFPWEFTSWSFSPVPDPVSFINQQFNTDWGLYSLMIFSLFPIYVMMWIIVWPRSMVRYDIHAFAVAVAGVICMILLVYYVLFSWVFENNNSVTNPFSVVNSVDFCCKDFGAVTASHACHNFHECVDLPTTPPIRLATNPVFERHLLGVAIAFVFLLFQIAANVATRAYVVSSNAAAAALPMSTADVVSNAPKEPSEAGRNFLHGVNTVYVTLTCCFLIFGLLVLNVRYTHQFPAVGPYGIRGARNSVAAVGLVMSSTAIVMPALVLLVMTVYSVRWLLWIVFVLMLLLVLVHLFAWFTMIYSRGTANAPGQPNSMANHPMRCCAADVYMDPSSECDNVVPCNLPVPQFPTILPPLTSSQIPRSPTHNLIFWMFFVLLILDVVCIACVVNTYIGQDSARQAADMVINQMYAVKSWASQPPASSARAFYMPVASAGQPMPTLLPQTPPPLPPPATPPQPPLQTVQHRFSVSGKVE